MYRYELTPPVFSFKKKYKDGASLIFFNQLKNLNYEDGYYFTGFFLKWLEEFYNPKIVNLLVKEGIKENFNIETFLKKNTKKNIDSLWKEFSNQYEDIEETKIFFVNESKKKDQRYCSI